MITGRLPVSILIAVFLCLPTFGQEPEVIHLDQDAEFGEDEPRQGAPPPIEGEGSAPAPGQGVDAREILTSLWFKQRAALSRGDVQESMRQAEVALEFMEREGLLAAPAIAAGYLTDARDALVQNDYKRAKDGFVLASKFEPNLVAARIGLGFTLLRGDRDPIGAVREWLTGLGLALTDPGILFYSGGNGVLIIYLGFFAGGFVAFLILAAAYVPAFLHDLTERFSERLSEEMIRLAGWAVLAAPLVILLPPAWVLAFWVALFFPYFRGREKPIAAGMLVLLMLSGPVGAFTAWHFGTATDLGARALIQAVRQGPDLRYQPALKRLMRDHPDDVIYPFLLAAAYRSSGRFDDSMAMYREVIRTSPHNARAMVNLGNLHALRQEYAVSQRYYRQAADNDPSLALAHYNSHLAHLESFHLDEADAELGEARRRDEDLTNDLIARAAADRGRRTPVDTAYTTGEIWQRVLRLRVGPGNSSYLERSIGMPGTLAGIVGLVIVLVLPGIGIAPRRYAGSRCGRCGRAFCRKCQVAGRQTDVCAQCTHLFVLRDGLAPGVKAKKMEEVSRFRRRRFLFARILALPFPGGGHVLSERVLFGASLLVVWFAAWFGLILSGRILVDREMIAPATGTIAILPVIILAILVWLVGNLSTHETGRG